PQSSALSPISATQAEPSTREATRGRMEESRWWGMHTSMSNARAQPFAALRRREHRAAPLGGYVWPCESPPHMEGRLPSFIQGTVSTFQLIYLYISVSYPGRCVSPPYGEQLMRGVSTWQRRHMRGERARS